MPKSTLFLPILISLVSFSANAATLSEAYQSALKKNEVLALQTSQVQIARERLNQVKGGIYPQLSVNAVHTIQPRLEDPTQRALFPEKQTSVALTGNQALFRGFREFAGVRQYKDMVAFQEENRNQALILLYQDVTAAYLTVLTLEQDLKNIQGQIEIYGDRVGELRGRTRRGESSSADLLSAQASEAVLQAEIQVVTGNLRMARENLTFMTGLSQNEVLIDPQLISKSKLAGIEQYLKRIENRYDFKAAQKQFEAMEEEVSIAKGAHWPSLDLIGNYYFQRPDVYDKKLNWDAQLKLTLPLFEGGATQAKVREAAAKRMEADLQLARVRRQAEQEIRSYYQNLQARLTQLEALKTAAGLSERNYQTVRKDYRRGLVRNIDVQLAMTDYRLAQRALDQARFSSQLDYLRLQTASAEILAPAVKEN